MGVVVFDSDVLIGYLDRADAHHKAARELVLEHYREGERLLTCATTYSEVLIGPLRVGRAEEVDSALGFLGFEVISVDMALAQRTAAVRLRTSLKLPDAFVIATAIHAEKRQGEPIRVASLDERVINAFDRLRPPQ